MFQLLFCFKMLWKISELKDLEAERQTMVKVPSPKVKPFCICDLVNHLHREILILLFPRIHYWREAQTSTRRLKMDAPGSIPKVIFPGMGSLTCSLIYRVKSIYKQMDISHNFPPFQVNDFRTAGTALLLQMQLSWQFV